MGFNVFSAIITILMDARCRVSKGDGVSRSRGERAPSVNIRSGILKSGAGEEGGWGFGGREGRGMHARHGENSLGRARREMIGDMQPVERARNVSRGLALGSLGAHDTRGSPLCQGYLE